MADGQEHDDGQGGAQHSEETLRLAALGRSNGADDGTAAAEEGEADEGSTPKRPDHVPEKFWDAEKGTVNIDNLLKSYTELEKARGQKSEEDDGDEADEGDEGKGEEEGSEEGAASGISPELFTAAQAEFAEKGQLSKGTRKSILDSGIPEATLDTYLAGVAALSAQLTQQVYETAGGEEPYKAALKWAGANWDQGRIAKFDAGIDDPDLRESLITGLMASYHAANPGEGKFTERTGGMGDSDVFASQEEFTQALGKADAAGDPVARKKAVEKWARTRKAGNVVMPKRRGMDRFQ